ncbi:MAG: hypothetical protein F2811_03380 [Actinobacteria bacterium]|nr:hypothetical protein [Actinomycetota bacterium]
MLTVLAIGAPAAMAATSSGKLNALKGGYRNIGTNTATNYAKPIAGAQLEYASSSSFLSPTAFPLTDAAGSTTTPSNVSGGTWYAREKTPASGWLNLASLDWDGSSKPYVGKAAVDGGTSTVSVDNGASTRFVNALVNPLLPSGTCGTGLKVLLVLDTSGSTSGYNDDYNQAATAFVTALSGTPSSVKISSFADSVSSGNATPYDMSTVAGQNSAKTRINNIYPNNTSGSGYTNWDAALQDASKAQVDAVVFITDGSPTLRVGGSTNSPGQIDDITYAIASANTAKDPDNIPGNADDQSLLAVGVGNGVAVENLKAVSGPLEGTDYVAAADPAALTALLKSIASKLCPGSITLNKKLVPSNDPGLFNLKINNVTKKTDATDGGTTGKQTLDPGLYPISEAGGTGTLLTDYSATTACLDQDNKNVPVTAGKVQLDTGKDLTCTITNTRKTGTLTVKKSLSPSNDPGLFNLKIDNVTKKADATDGGTTGQQTVNTGNHQVGESNGTNTGLDNYTSSILCKDGNSTVASGSGTSLSPVPVADGKDIICTITNTRKTGKLTVKKSLSPSTDPGLFNLQIDSVTKKTDATDGGTTGQQTANTGIRTVGETAGTNTTLSGYTSSIICKDGASTAGSGKGTSLDVRVDEGKDIICTITNIKDATLTVKKSLSPSNDPGLFNLQINGITKKTDATDGGTTGQLEVTEFNNNVGETAGTGTTLSDYTSSILCKDGDTTVASGNGTSLADVPVAESKDIICTITNTRKTGKLTVKKSLSPSNDPGLFNLQIDSVTKKADATDGGTTGQQTVKPGIYEVGETQGTNTDLSDYTSSIRCKDGVNTVTSGPGTSLSRVPVGDGEDIICTITNIRDASVTIEKATLPSSDTETKFGFTSTLPGSDFSLTGNGAKTGKISVKPNPTDPYKVTENSTTGWQFTKLDCGDTKSVEITDATVAINPQPGENITCVYTNTQDATVTIAKETKTVGTGDTAFKFKATNGLSDPFEITVTGQGTESKKISNVTPGNEYSISEGPATGWQHTGLKCEGGGSPSYDGFNKATITPAAGENITCTYTNTQDATVTINKGTVPSSDNSTEFGFTSTLPGSDFVLTGNGATTGMISVTPNPTDPYKVTENSAPGWQFTNLDCTETKSVEITDATVAINPQPGENITCTYTNTQDATVTINKATLPSSDNSTEFDFTSTLPGSNFVLTGNGDTTGKISVTPNPAEPYKVTENATTGWQFTKLECSDTKSVEIDGASVAISPQPGENIACTYTNTQDGTIKVVKSVLPEADPGVFNLQIGGKTYAENVPNTDTNSTGVQTFAPGEYPIGETAGTDPVTDLENYKASYDCGKASFDSETRTVTLNPGEDVVCTITNTRNTGTITLKKSLDPTTDGGKFNLAIGGTVYAENVGHNGTTEAQTLNSGTSYSLDETAGTGTSLDNYTSELACTESDEPIPVVESSVQLGAGQNIICTFTNTRKTGTITLKKTLAPANDPGLFNLQIGGSTLASNVGGGGTTGAQALPAGASYTLGETAGTGTSLADYAATLDCSDAQGPVTITDSSVALGAGQEITCNLTNTRKTGTVTITKNVTDGSAGTFAFSGTIGPNFTLDTGQSTQFTLAPGTYTVTEGLSAAFTLQALTCTDSGDASGGSTVDVPTGTATINLQSGEAVTCTYLNAPGGGVLPGVTGTARVSGANGCASGKYTYARVRGTNIASVKYYLYGKLVKTLTKRNKSIYYQLNQPVSKLRYGVSLVTARVTFVQNSTPATKTMTIRLSRCRPATPRFTG